MKHFFLFLILILILSSCGKKKQVIHSGTTESDGVLTNYWEEYIDHDSAFYTTTDPKTGLLLSIDRAKNDSLLNAGTFTEVLYYSPSGKVKSVERKENKMKVDFNAWYESGKIRVKEELLPDSTYRHREYYENGNPQKEMVTDKNGKGSSSFWFMNGKLHSTGPICDFNPCGIWKGYDSLGNPAGEELMGIPKADSLKSKAK